MCDLLDVACHIQSAAWEWWAEVTWLNKVLIVLGIVGLIASACMGILRLVKSVAGWPGVAAALLVLLGLVLAILPKPPKGKPGDGGDTRSKKGPFKFGVERRKAATGKPLNETPWLRQPGETAADWLERTTTAR